MNHNKTNSDSFKLRKTHHHKTDKCQKANWNKEQVILLNYNNEAITKNATLKTSIKEE